MTPLPTQNELAQRYIYDPPEGTIHIRGLINRAKDGQYVKDIISDYLIGVLGFGKVEGCIKVWEGQLFQMPFRKGMRIRSGQPHCGRPFLDPDGLPMEICNRLLCGYQGDNGGASSMYTFETVKRHPNYQQWKRNVLFAGGNENDGVYKSTGQRNSLKDCDRYVNGRAYEPGPDSEPQTDYHRIYSFPEEGAKLKAPAAEAEWEGFSSSSEASSGNESSTSHRKIKHPNNSSAGSLYPKALQNVEVPAKRNRVTHERSTKPTDRPRKLLSWQSRMLHLQYSSKRYKELRMKWKTEMRRRSHRTWGVLAREQVRCM